jgi:hypothetical protein
MKHTFRPDSKKGTHTRIADGARGTLHSHPDIVTVQPESALVDPSGYTLYVEPAPEPAPAPPPPTQAELIKIAENHIATYFTAFGLLEGLKKLMQAQASNNLAAVPKTVATAQLVETVKGMALAGQTYFPPAPYTFEEVVLE